ncbi:MAG: glutamine-hydrolyzing GMP synthase [Nitrospiria bacterium]
MDIHTQKILILDFGSQYTQLIARRVRESKVYSEILPYQTSLSKIKQHRPCGIILSGGPSSVYDRRAPSTDARLFELGVPILGICYGMQLITHQLGGSVARAQRREYGKADLIIDDGQSDLFKGVTDSQPTTTVWMSHGDRIEKMPAGFKVMAHTDHSPVASMAHPQRKLYALQFHPEVVHTPGGTKILQNFVYRICGCQPTWTMHSFREEAIRNILAQVKNQTAICALSGGVDSCVAATLVHEAIGNRLTCIFVDNGLLRLNEVQQITGALERYFKLNIRYIDSSNLFLKKLANVADPEQKRKVIGNLFIQNFESEARRLGRVVYLVQGTLYPDVIESVSVRGPSATIKTHHNVGGLPTRMKLKLIEPLRELFKDEVRLLGGELGIPGEILRRHPFPGPGLAVRVIGEVTRERLEILRQADAIVEEEIRRAGRYDSLWQAFAVLLPIKTVGVMGDERTYENVMAIRAVTSQDGMTADWARLPPELLGALSNRIINEVKGVNRVVYDISSKPPSTIEWE